MSQIYVQQRPDFGTPRAARLLTKCEDLCRTKVHILSGEVHGVCCPKSALRFPLGVTLQVTQFNRLLFYSNKESDDMGVRLAVFLGLLFTTCAEDESSGSWVWKRLWQPHVDGICSALCPQDEVTPCPTTPPEPTPPIPPEPTDFCQKNPKTLACQLVATDPELAIRFYKENQWAFLREGARHKEDTPTDQDVVISEEQEQEQEQVQVRDDEDRAGARKKIREWKQAWGSDQDSEGSDGNDGVIIPQPEMTYGHRRYSSWSSSRSIVTARPDAIVGEGAVIRGQFRPVTVKMNMNVRRRGQVMRSTFRTHRREQGETVMQPGGGEQQVQRSGETVWRRREVRRRQARQAPVTAGACRSQGKITTPRRVRVDGKWQDFELYSFQVGRSVFQRFYAVSCVDRKPVTHCDCGGVCQDKFSQFVALQIYKDDNNDIKVRPRLVEVPTCCELVIPS